MIRATALAIFVMAFFSGCSVFRPTEKRCYELYPPTILTIDSTFVVDSIIIRQPEEVIVWVPIPDDGPDSLVIIDKGPVTIEVGRHSNDSLRLNVRVKGDTTYVRVPNWDKIQAVIDSTNKSINKYWIEKSKEEFDEKSRKLRTGRNTYRWAFFVTLAVLLAVIWISIKR